MKHQNSWISKVLLLCVVAMVSLGGIACSKKEETVTEPKKPAPPAYVEESLKDLPNGYMFLQTDKTSGWIMNAKKRIAVESNVVSLFKNNDIIYGERAEPTNPAVLKTLQSKAFGFFVLDTKSGELKQGLSEAEAKKLAGVTHQ